LIFLLNSNYPSLATATCDQDTHTLASEALLTTLLDEEPAIRLTAHNFWTSSANMPSSTIDRLVLILGSMYSSHTETEFLSYATNLLLERTSKSPDYNRLVYENPLSECVFREYNLTADWRRRHEMMTPLFVDTLASCADEPEFPFKYPTNEVNYIWYF
jgi:DNA-dependent protein kinase catalytic subunit